MRGRVPSDRKHNDGHTNLLSSFYTKPKETKKKTFLTTENFIKKNLDILYT